MQPTEVLRLASRMPDAFDSMWWHLMHPGGMPDWQRDGESMQDARDRMKRERAAAKARLG